MYQIPDDQFYDYVPITPEAVQLGMDVLAVVVNEGAVTAVTAPGALWSFDTQYDALWGPVTGFAEFPVDPTLMPPHWWLRQAIWKQTDHLDDGASITLADGSRWIFDNAGDGKLNCYRAGGAHVRGERVSRGQLTTNPNDLPITDDPAFDWLPVLDGATVSVADYIRSSVPRSGIVDDITTDEIHPGYVRTTVWADGVALGVFDTVTDPFLPSLPMISNFYQRLLKPVLFSRSSASDGSRWMYVDGGLYYCWSHGTVYPQGSLAPRGQIGLTPLPPTGDPVPPLVREAVQTVDGLVGSATLTVGPSTVAGDVLLIVQSVLYFTTPPTITDPTSTAGAVTQVGTDATDGRGNGCVRVFRCPVGSSGTHTITVPSAGGAEQATAVLVITDDASTDGFASATVYPGNTFVTAPSVTPTGAADLLVCIYFNNDSCTFDPAPSGLIVRASATATAGALLIGTVELESSGATGAGHRVNTSDEAFPLALSVALLRT